MSDVEEKSSILTELGWRNVLNAFSGNAEELLETQKPIAYMGFDATADSLHIGHLAQIITIQRLIAMGVDFYVVVGHTTAVAGDPSGRTSKREPLDVQTSAFYAGAISVQLYKLLPDVKQILVNTEWLGKISFVDFLSKIAPHFNVNTMCSKESVKSRQEGLMLPELMYQVLQAYDFFYLSKHYGVNVQVGGSDQWGNMVAGMDLISKVSNKEVCVITTKLITRPDGTKFGKSDGGETIWLDPTKTTPYEFFQFWYNTSDEEVEQHLKTFTMLSSEVINRTMASHRGAPSLRLAQLELAKDVTATVHGWAAMTKADELRLMCFDWEKFSNTSKSSREILHMTQGQLPTSQIERQRLQAGIGVEDLLKEAGVVKSKRQATNLIEQGGVHINNEQCDLHRTYSDTDLFKEHFLLVRVGKKNFHLITVP